ncbi:MAG: response regulator, partial [Desulfobulbaceae bacterium]|nr:response regulator [Desulfobulbaceae bacterium]
TKIFDPFFSTKKKGHGTGLGLSMVYGIIKDHDGYIDVISESGKGATFVIYLPAVQAVEDGKNEAAATEKKEAEKLPGGTETILLIDDEVVIRDLSKVLLEQQGYKVLLAEDGEKGISLYKTERDKIDLVLLDMIMPNKTGSEVFHELMKINPDVQIIIVSGFSLDNQARKLINDGACTFIQKPYQPHKLLHAIREALD